MRNQPAPPHVVFEALIQPNRDPARQWLRLLDDEQVPRIREANSNVVWSALWLKRLDATIEFEQRGGRSSGTDLRWRLLVDEPAPDEAQVGHMRKRVNELINAELRYSFGQ